MLSCNGDNASTASVSDNPSPEIYISSTSSVVPVNSSVTVSWVSKNVSSCIASGDWEGVRPTSGLESFIIESAKTYNFNLNCSRLNTSHFAKVTINGYQAWNFTQRGFDLNGEASNDQSGLSLSLDSDGDILAIWSKNSGASGNNNGHTRIYAWNGITWVQRGNDIDGEAEGDNSGYSLSLSSD
ncbi:hypothetical protein N9X63_07350, partial [Woeseiaceae bacterium]|nr:hypothetical protein [Woeseiaceae bacterium]